MSYKNVMRWKSKTKTWKKESEIADAKLEEILTEFLHTLDKSDASQHKHWFAVYEKEWKNACDKMNLDFRVARATYKGFRNAVETKAVEYLRTNLKREALMLKALVKEGWIKRIIKKIKLK